MTPAHRRPTQAERVLAILGDRGWHSTFEFIDQHHILRPAARVHELRLAGHAIETRRCGHGVFEYRHAGSPLLPAPPAAVELADVVFDQELEHVGSSPVRGPGPCVVCEVADVDEGVLLAGVWWCGAHAELAA